MSEINNLNNGNITNDSMENITVLIRVRPHVTEEADNQTSIIVHDPKNLTVTSSDGKKSFNCSFDNILSPTSTQIDVYNAVKMQCTNSVINGFNR